MEGPGRYPRLTRRRDVGTASARSLLMTLLGEYVLPRDRPTWTSVVVEALAALGVEEKAARQALARCAAEGWIGSERDGRRVHWSLTEPGRRRLTESGARILAFGRETAEWDGRWLVIMVTVPDPHRDLRQQLRTRLTWAGFGSPEPGVWISPDPTREREAAEVIEALGLGGAMSFTAAYGGIGSQAAMVARAWDLSALEARYEDFAAEFGALRPDDDAAALRAQTRLVHEWQRFPFLDPRLPRELLPEAWSGAKAVDVFHARHTEWDAAAQRGWEALESEAVQVL
ncbi:PaaX family transcriptional regulator C-terminal domain-containing protein [Catenulispora yoronensis]|uniref:PaaX family transcriptional regulator C-terminal domain-containing protein n=1 Tax=Catenulispora yoronensis TaxID=450799 RepID=A0ABP5FA87_9ACTN